MRILLVEDESTLAGQLAGADQAGYAVDHAADGIDAEHLGANIPMTPSCSTWACPGSTA
jgi:two-component system OmpR family response regulator